MLNIGLHKLHVTVSRERERQRDREEQKSNK